MSYQPYRSPFGDTTLTKVFVGGLAWETQTDVMRRYFEQFGEILEAVIIKDKNTGKSKGYGFVTFRRAESARRACADPNPIIDGRRANCNIASMGRTRPPTPRGRIQGGNPYQGGPVPQGASSSYRGVPVGISPPPPPPPPPPPVLYPPYGYPTYSPDYGYPQSIYYPQLQQPQYFHQQLHGVSPSSTMGSPYFYGYNNDPMQAASRGTAPQAQSIQGPPYQLYYPRQMEGSFTYPPLPPPPPPPPPILPSQPSLSTRHSTDLQPPQHTSTETEVGAVTSESPET